MGNLKRPIEEGLEVLRTNQPDLEPVIDACRAAVQEVGVALEGVDQLKEDQRRLVLTVLRVLTVSSPDLVGKCMHGNTKRGIVGAANVSQVVAETDASEDVKSTIKKTYRTVVPREEGQDKEIDDVLTLLDTLNKTIGPCSA